MHVLDGESGRDIVHMPLGAEAARRYGAPYWVVHRGDLHAALATAAQERGVTVKLGTRVEDVAADPNGVSVCAHGRAGFVDERGIALIAADGLWSVARARLGHGEPARFSGRIAWRALIRAQDAPSEFREPTVRLWLGRNAHLVHYPVRGGDLINIVAIADDAWNGPGWSEPASRADLLTRFSAHDWAPQALALVRTPDSWLKWALYDREPIEDWSQGPVALLGDAAHPMLPYLAQGAAMAIEDAAAATQCLARLADDPAAAWRVYCRMRRARAAKVQRLAARNGARYHLGGVRAMLRNAAMRMLGGARLMRHYDWLYDWRPPATLSLD